MISAKEIYDIVNQIAPFKFAEEYDNVGIIYDSNLQVNRVLFALDITDETIDEAINLNCGIIVSHHPILFHAVKKIGSDDLITKAIKNDISLITAHTNYDKVKVGTSSVLASSLGLLITEDVSDGLGRIGYYEKPMTQLDFIMHVKSLLCTNSVSAVVGKKKIKRVLVIAGSSGDIEEFLKLKIDAIVTGETKYSNALEAKRQGKTLVIAGHYETENIGFKGLHEIISKVVTGNAECFYSKEGRNPIKYF